MNSSIKSCVRNSRQLSIKLSNAPHTAAQVAPLAFWHVAPLAYRCAVLCGAPELHSTQAQRTSPAPPTPTHLHKGVIVVQPRRLALLPPAAHAAHTAHACGPQGSAAATQDHLGAATAGTAAH